MAWLVMHDRVLATLEIADTWRTRTRGALGRDEMTGAIWLTPARGIHTFGMRLPLDVAFCDADMRVVDVATVAPNRILRPRLAARSVIEAEANSLERWGVTVGSELEVRR